MPASSPAAPSTAPSAAPSTAPVGPVVPFIDLQPVTRLVRDAVAERWRGALERCEFVGGPAVHELERALAHALGAREVVTCASGTSALVLALQAAGVGPGDHVALPNLTFWATFEAVATVGAVPVLVDIDPDDLQLCVDELRAAADRFPLRAVLTVHLFGWASARLDELRAFCGARALPLVEDGAQCFGVERSGAPLLAEAELATLSFYPAKVLGGCGDGGAILFGGEGAAARAARARSLANHGRAAHYAFDAIGWSSRLAGPNAHYLLEMLGHMPAVLADRRARAARLRAAGSGWRRARTYAPPAGLLDNGYLNVLALDDDGAAEAAAAQLSRRGVATARTYPSTMDQQPPAAGRFVTASALRHSRAFVRRVLNLPLFYGMSAEQEVHVVACAEEVFAT